MVTKKKLMERIEELEKRIAMLERANEASKASVRQKERDKQNEKAQAEMVKALMDFRPKHVFNPYAVRSTDRKE